MELLGNMSESTDETPVSWKQKSLGKRKALAALMPEKWHIRDAMMPPPSQLDVTSWPASSGWFTDGEVAITELSASDLASRLCSGQLRSEDVTQAFCKRAAAAHQLTNCLSEIVFERALATARARDRHMKLTGKPLGPLHGLPVSLKDNFHLRHVDSTVGLTSHVDDAADADSTLVALLEQAGAVVYVKTNVPTAMMIAETVNNVTGRTLNPLNRNTTSGGSSGGESALIAFRGSPLGVGTDIGGSIRVPAACTGIFGLRPSSGRFPSRNCRSGLPGQEAVQSVSGPMARHLCDIELYCETMIGQQPWLRDPRCLPMPWRRIALPQRLRIGVMYHDGMVLPTPPVRRALDATVKRLLMAGHDMVKWNPVGHSHGASLLNRMFIADGGRAIGKQLRRTGEPWMPELETFRVARELSTYQLWKLHMERVQFSEEYLDRWNAARLDAILCPTTPYSTVKHGAFAHVCYTSVFNVVDYSCLSYPTGLVVDSKKDKLDATYKPLSPTCKMINESYNAELVDGLPISLQLVAQRLEEEKLLAMAKRLLYDCQGIGH